MKMSALSRTKYLTYQNSFFVVFLHRSSQPFFWHMALLPRDVVPCPPVAPYAVWSGGTTHLYLWERSINLLPQTEMKTRVYNPGGANRARIAERMDTALQRRQFRPAYEKLQISR